MFLKTDNDWEQRISVGRELYKVGAAVKKLLSPYDFRQLLSTTRSPSWAERSLRAGVYEGTRRYAGPLSMAFF